MRTTGSRKVRGRHYETHMDWPSLYFRCQLSILWARTASESVKPTQPSRPGCYQVDRYFSGSGAFSGAMMNNFIFCISFFACPLRTRPPTHVSTPEPHGTARRSRPCSGVLDSRVITLNCFCRRAFISSVAVTLQLENSPPYPLGRAQGRGPIYSE